MGRKETRPLRLVVGHILLPLTDVLHPVLEWFEVYECGHVRRPKQDMAGQFYATRRRCAGCVLGKPPDVALDDPRITKDRKKPCPKKS